MNKYFVILMAFFSVVLWSQVTIADPLNLSKSADIREGGCVFSGEELTYTICFANPNSYDVDDAVITDTLPDNTSFVSADSDGDYNASSHSVIWEIGTLAKKTEDTEEAIETCVELKIEVTALPGTVLTNEATIVSSEETSPVVEEDTTICPITVSVDIKPGGCPTPINVGSKGVLPVAVLGTADFDVTTIDPESITLEGVFPLRWAMEDVATPHPINVDECDIMDCNELPGDGYVDLTLKFDTQAIYEAIREVKDRDCLILDLTGNLNTASGGFPFKGGDVVSILKKGKKHNVVPANSLLLK